NIGLVLGITAIISPLTISEDFYKLNWPMMMLLSIALFFILKSGLIISFIEGLLLFLSIIVFLYILIKRSKEKETVEIEEIGRALQETSKIGRASCRERGKN